MADHGEAFGEHGEQRHGMFLYDETVHVPLLIKLPATRAAGKRVEAGCTLADVAPSLLKVAGFSVPSGMQGQSLMAWMDPMCGRRAAPAGAPTGLAEHPVYSETNYPHKAFGWKHPAFLEDGKVLVCSGAAKELYDQARIRSYANVADDSNAVAGTLESQLMEFQAKTSNEQKEKKAMDPAQAENLRALGYLASDDSKNSQDADESAIDPKDKIEVANHCIRRWSIWSQDSSTRRFCCWNSVAKGEPRSSTGHLELGRALVHVKRYEEAFRCLGRRSRRCRIREWRISSWGLAFVKTGQWDLALPEFQTADDEFAEIGAAAFLCGRHSDQIEAQARKRRRNTNLLCQMDPGALPSESDFRTNSAHARRQNPGAGSIATGGESGAGVAGSAHAFGGSL